MLTEVVPPGHHAVHVMLLILHRAKQRRVLQVHHLRYATAGGAEQFALRRGGAGDEVIGSAEVLAQQLRLRGQVHALTVRGEHAVLDVHAGVERLLAHLAQDDGLIGGLLCVTRHEHDPPGVECRVDVVVRAVHIERMLGEGAGTHLQHHGGELAGGMVVLLHRVHDALAAGEVHRAPPGDGEGRGSPLRGMLAFGFGGDLLLPPDVQFTGGERCLIDLPALGGRGDGVEDAAFGDARFHVLRDQLVAAAGDVEAGIPVLAVAGGRRGRGGNRGVGHGGGRRGRQGECLGHPKRAPG